MQAADRTIGQPRLNILAQHKERAAQVRLAQVLGEPVGVVRLQVGGAVEGQQKQPVVHLVAIALVVAETIEFAAGLRKQRGLAHQFVQILHMEDPARLGPLGVIAVVADHELGGLLTQGRQVFDEEAERGVLIAALLGVVVVGQQALPEALAQAVDRVDIDRAQAQALGQRGFVHRFGAEQATGEHEDFRP